jgi:hypothetical protein
MGTSPHLSTTSRQLRLEELTWEGSLPQQTISALALNHAIHLYWSLERGLERLMAMHHCKKMEYWAGFHDDYDCIMMSEKLRRIASDVIFG